MDHPSRPSDTPKPSRRRATTPVMSEKPQSSPTVPPSGSSSSTPLPSIRQLHPHLPPPASFYASSEGSGYAQIPLQSGSEPGPSGTTAFPPAAVVPQLSDLPPILEDSDSDKDVSVPPKKRRKRQALSCTGHYFFFHPPLYYSKVMLTLTPRCFAIFRYRFCHDIIRPKS
jgi:hypothetical protein